MKRVVCIVMALVLLLALACPAFAAENHFVPSITYKPSPDIIPVADEEGNEYLGVIRNAEGEIVDYVDHSCIVLTPVAHVWDEEKDIPEEVEELLLFVHSELNEEGKDLPYEKFDAGLDPANMVIRDLFDVRWNCEEHPEMVLPDGVYFEITFDLGVMPDVEIFAMTYDEEGKDWHPIVKTVNNGDGTVTCTFEHLCAVAFAMPVAAASVPQTEPQSTSFAWGWLVAFAVAAVAVVVMMTKKKKA